MQRHTVAHFFALFRWILVPRISRTWDLLRLLKGSFCILNSAWSVWVPCQITFEQFNLRTGNSCKFLLQTLDRDSDHQTKVIGYSLLSISFLPWSSPPCQEWKLPRPTARKFTKLTCGSCDQSGHYRANNSSTADSIHMCSLYCL